MSTRAFSARGFARIGWTIALGLVWFASASAPAIAFDPESRLAEGVAAYQSALEASERETRLAGFDRARRLFASLVEAGVETPSLLVNLGNAALQSEDRGGAILAYRRALRLDPEAASARQNLEVARAGLPAWMPRPETERGFRSFLDERAWPRAVRARLAGLAFFGAALALALAVRGVRGPWRGIAVLGGLVWIGLLASMLLAGGAGTQEAVVTVESVVARTADSSRATQALPEPLPGGAEVVWLETRGDWARVRLANGRDVWLRATALTFVEES